MIDAQAIRKAKKVLDRLNYKVEEANQRISEFTEKAEANEQWAKEKAQEAVEEPLRSHLGKIELAAYYAKAAAKHRAGLEIWEKRHSDAVAQLQTAAGNYDEVREGMPEDIDQRVDLMGKYQLEWFFTADRWIIDPLKCSLETFEMLCDLERRTNDALWNHFCKDEYEWDSEDPEEIPLQWQRDRLANAEAFLWNCRIDSDWYDQGSFEDLALNTPVTEFQDRLWDFFDEAREERGRLEEEEKPEVKCLSEDIFAGIDVGNSEPISHTFTIYEPNPDTLRLFFPEPSEEDQEEVWYSPEENPLEDLNGLAERYEALERDLSEPTYTPYKDWDAVLKAAQKARDRLNERLSPWLLRWNRPSLYTDYTELTGVKRREGVTFEEVERWVRENSAEIPGLNLSSEGDLENIFRALFGSES